MRRTQKPFAQAAVRPAMRFVAVKTEEQQARAMLFRTRDLGSPAHATDQCAPRSLGRAWRRRPRGTSERKPRAGATMRCLLNHCRAWDRSPRWRLRLSRRRWRSSDAAATLPPGSGLFPGNIRRAHPRFSAKPRRWARGKLAASHAGAQATDVVGHRTCQQTGARDLGHADEGRRLSGACSCSALIHDRTVQPRKRRAREEVDER